MPEQQPHRLLRTGMFTLVCASVSAHGHQSSSGDEVPLSGLLVGMAVVFAIAWAVSSRRHSTGMLTAWMLWGQLALHVAYSATPGAGHTGHFGDEVAPGSSAWAMPATHVLAAALGAWWLKVGEERFFAFLEFMALAVFTLLLVLTLPLPRYRVPVSVSTEIDQSSGGHSLWLRYTLTLRGPPLLTAV